MIKSKRFSHCLMALLGLMMLSSELHAAAPKSWQLGMQPAATPVMERLSSMHDALLYLIITICILVFIVLGYTLWRFSEKRNPVAAKFSHNTMIEVVWTAIPVIIISLIAIPSVKLLYFMDKTEKAEMTVKVIAHQWYWEYEYPDHGNLKFDSYMIEDKDLKPGQLRLLEVDNRVVIPADTNVRVILTSADVVHSWAVPAFGVKKDTVPGRINETWMRVNKEGIYYGQCSELCGARHGFMPIAVEVVSKEKFNRWVEEAKAKFS